MRTTLTVLLLLASTALAVPEAYPSKILRVIDGDTLEVETEVWPGFTVKTRVRLAGVNTPEKTATAPCERAAAAKASAFTQAFVAKPKATITLILAGRDKYGRELGYLKVDGQDLGAALIGAGHARPYKGERRGAWC